MTIQQAHVVHYRRNQNNKARKAAKKAAQKPQRGIVAAYHNIYDAVNEQRKQQANGRTMAGFNSYNDDIVTGFDKEITIIAYIEVGHCQVGQFQDAHVQAYIGSQK